MAERRRHSDARRNLSSEKAAAETIPIAGWLLVLDGQQKGDDFRIREGKNTIGSDPSSEICIMDAHVSRRHASLTVKRRGPTEGEFRVVDLDSENGTFLNQNEERVSMEELVDNDTITFGKIRCRFKCVG